jgi:hypothetical protein
VNEIFNLLECYVAYIGCYVTEVSGNLSVPYPRVKPKKDVRKTSVHSYIGNGVGGDWFRDSVMPANRIKRAKISYILHSCHRASR